MSSVFQLLYQVMSLPGFKISGKPDYYGLIIETADYRYDGSLEAVEEALTNGLIGILANEKAKLMVKCQLDQLLSTLLEKK